jgi:predicted TIM-barrel fold metal-dependent hydrolase
MPREAPLFREGICDPPVRRYAGPIVDAHTHVGSVAEARHLLAVAGRFGVRTICGVVRPHVVADLVASLGDSFRPIVWVDHTHVARPKRFARDNIAALRAAARAGAVAAKFWYSPRFFAETGLRFDNPTLRPVLEALVELDLAALVHVADPDCWFQRHYSDVGLYGTKPQQYEALEAVLAAVPRLRLQAAHFGGDPENLDHLRRLLDAHANLHIDTSATKWVARELSARPDAARAFVVERADRIVFGSDLVTFADAADADYASRYWVHRWLWEGRGERPSPVPDPCAPWPDGPRVAGLDLPDDVLAKLYAANAARLLKVTPAPEDRP